MNRGRLYATAAVVAIIGLSAGFAARYWVDSSSTPQVPAAQSPAVPVIGQFRPGFELPDLDGDLRNADEWNGSVLVVNFWATWCPPCRREMPAFIALQESYGERGLQFIGIAIDNPENVADFADGLGVNYPILLGDSGAIALGQRFGNRYGTLPYTVIVDRAGKITAIHRDEVTKDQLEQEVIELL